MLALLISLCCPKAYHKHHHSVRIVECHREELLFLNPTSSPGLQPTTQFGSVTFSPIIFSPKHCSWFSSTIVLSYQATQNINGTRTRDRFTGLWLLRCNLLVETNNFGLCAVLLSSFVSELQKPPSPGLEPRTSFRNLYFSEISPWH
jgi:hypothetical protein